MLSTSRKCFKKLIERWYISAGALPMSASALSPRAYELYQRVKKFIDEKVVPHEQEIHALALDPKLKWTIHPKLEELKVS